MPSHIRAREDRGSIYYIVDGGFEKSTGTRNRRLAEHLLKQYNEKKFHIGRSPTWDEYFDRFIASKTEPLHRRAALRDYKQHYKAYISQYVGSMPLADLRYGMLKTIQASLLKKGLSVKTVRNIMSGTMRAIWREARAEDLVAHNPFELLQWPLTEKPVPDPFTVEERDAVLAQVQKRFPLYYPYVYTQFHTGMRPSESAALRLTDLDSKARTFSITKSRYLKSEGPPKTAHSRRRILVPDEVWGLIELLRYPNEPVNGYVFYNHILGPVHPAEWAGKFWSELCEDAGVRRRKFYSTRHTFITEAVKAGIDLKRIADHCGTSVRMIEDNYCARLGLSVLPPPKVDVVDFKETSVVVPTGLEPLSTLSDHMRKAVRSRAFKLLHQDNIGQNSAFSMIGAPVLPPVESSAIEPSEED